MTTQDFLNVLFNPNEATCFSTSPFGTNLAPIYSHTALHPAYVFFSINPMVERRLDANVVEYRNILLEFDGLPLAEQANILSEIPKSTVVFSGGKSYHAIISLEEPVKTRAAYDHLVRRIYDRVPGVDKANKNPSRFSRMANALRDGNILQELIYVGSRISNAALETWLGPDVMPEPEVVPARLSVVASDRVRRVLKSQTHYFLSYGAPDGHWNNKLFTSALDMLRSGYTTEELWHKLGNVTGILDTKDRSH
jgi:hypothetical protein